MATTFSVAIDWDHNGTWTDETIYTRRAQIKSGFDTAGGPGVGDANVAGVGRCTLTMDNTSQRFSPGYSPSPLYGELLPRREVRIQASDGVTTWTLFRGFIERIQPDAGAFGAGGCVIDCVDAVALLARQRIGVVYADAKPVDDAVSAVVGAAYTPPAMSYSDNGDSLAHYGRSWLPERTTAIAALREICDAVYGRFYIARDGTATYITRDDRLDSSGDAALAVGPSGAYWQRVRNTESANLVGLWRLNESSGTTAADSSGNNYDGTYAGVTLAGLVGPDGVNAALFDGINDDVDLYSASLAGAFDGSAGTLLIWFKVTDGSVWTDGSERRAVTIQSGNDSILLIKDNGSNAFQFYYRPNNSLTHVFKYGVSDAGWVCAAVTWSAANDAFKAYWNGVQEGTTQTGLDTWVSAPTVISIGSTTVSKYWSGGLAVCALWDKALSDAQILALGSV